MPILRHPKHERFCQEMAAGKSQVDAYHIAGYTRHRSNAAKLARADSIRARLAELLDNREKMAVRSTEMAADRAAISLATLTEDLKRVAYKAELLDSAGGYSAARAAYADIAKLHGLMVDRHEVGGPGDFERMKDEELAAFIRDGLARLEAPARKH